MSFPIIGINFLRSHGLLVDVANLRLLPGEPPVVAVASIADQVVAAVQSRSYADVVKGSSSPTPSIVPFSGSSLPPFPGTSLARPSPPIAESAAHCDRASDYLDCLRSRFPVVFNASSAVSLSHPPHGVLHFITTVGQPSTAKFRRLDPARLAAAKAEFQTMLDEGIIRCSCSQWSSPLHMVQKDGTWRPCGDYCLLNRVQ